MGNNMVQKKANERLIRISDIMWEIIFGWRLLLICAIVLAVTLGGVMYLKDKKEAESAASKDSQQQELISVEELEAELTEVEYEQILVADKLAEHKNQLETYWNESIWINLDAYAVDMVVLQYYVDTNYTFDFNMEISPDYAEDVISAYVSYVNNHGACEQLSNAINWGVEARYLGELIGGTANESGKMFSVNIMGKDANKTNELARAVNEVLLQYQQVISGKIGTHELILIDQYNSTRYDSALADEQEKIEKALALYEEEYDARIANFSKNQLAVWKARQDRNEGVENKDSETIATPTPTVNIKYILLGGFGGVFLAVLWIAFTFLLNVRLKNADEIQQMHGVRSLGTLWENGKKKRIFAVVDKWLYKIKNKETLTIEEQRELMLTNISVGCRKEQVTKVYFASSVQISESDKKQVVWLCEQLREEGIEAEYGERVMVNAEAIEKMAETGQLILVEKVGLSHYDAIEKVIGVCCDLEINILGAVAL